MSEERPKGIDRAMRAARILEGVDPDRTELPGYDDADPYIRVHAEVIVRETGLADLLAAAIEVNGVLENLIYRASFDTLAHRKMAERMCDRLNAAIAKANGA